MRKSRPGLLEGAGVVAILSAIKYPLIEFAGQQVRQNGTAQRSRARTLCTDRRQGRTSALILKRTVGIASGITAAVVRWSG